jgi:predicted PurR-regulated permease PerM
MLSAKPYTLDRVVRLAIGGGLVYFMVRLLGSLSDVLLPFFAALLLAYLMNPLVSRLQRRLKHRVPAVLAGLVLSGTAVAAAVWLVAPLLAREFGECARIISDLLNNSAVAAKVAQVLPEDLWHEIRTFLGSSDVRDFLQSGQGMGMIREALRKLLPGMWGVLSGTASLLVGIAGLSVILLYVAFLLLDFDKLSSGWLDYLPASMRQPADEFLDEFLHAMNGYFRAQSAIAACVGVSFAVGFSLIGLPMAILMGLMLGVMNMVPYLQLLGMPPAFFLALLHAVDTGGSIWTAMGLTALVFAVVQTLQDAVLTPRIMGGVTGLSPVIILLSLSIWGKLLGFLGLLIAIPATCLVLAYYRRLMLNEQN